MSTIESFVASKRKAIKVETICDKIKKLPWYRRPIDKESFISRKGKDGNLYVHHLEWSKYTWIGPYQTQKEVDDVINVYVTESLKAPLERKQHKLIHSLCVEDDNFFVKNE